MGPCSDRPVLRQLCRLSAKSFLWALDRSEVAEQTYRIDAQKVLVRRALRPGFDLVVTLEIVPGLAAAIILEPPPRVVRLGIVVALAWWWQGFGAVGGVVGSCHVGPC